MQASALIALFCLIDYGASQLFPINEDSLTPYFYDLTIPTERTGLDDCATRYYKYARDNLASPVLGTPVKLSEFAHMAAIGWIEENGEIVWNCGGSLISESFILTAGHCTIYEGKPPSFARLGDLNLYTSEDDEFAQEFQIIEVIVHPDYRSNTRYNDLALLRLDGKIRPHRTVLPACLWNDDTFFFEKFEAIGFGQVGFLKNKTDRLLKVTLNPVDTESCRQYYGTNRRLKDGIVDYQLCARDDSTSINRMDTCLGDSGGPLQAKLLGNGRMTPFIVGLTSFGQGCADDAPGVYTRVSKFIDWIEGAVGESFNPQKCTLRYVSLREFQPGITYSYLEGDGKNVSFSDWLESKVHIARDYRHKAHLGRWKDQHWYWFCGASLISENYLLTAAHCTDLKPELARIGDLRLYSEADDEKAQIREIAEIITHPKYEKSQIYNDIALVRLSKDVDLNIETVPACIWKKPTLPTDTYEVVGWGSRISNLYFIDLTEDIIQDLENDEVFPHVLKDCDELCQVNRTKPLEFQQGDPKFDEIRYLEVNSSVISNQECNKFFLKNEGTVILDSQLCAKNEIFAVPGICELDIGGVLERKIWGYSEYNSFIFGVNSFGKNCGFGTPIVTTKVSSYADWIESVVLNKELSKHEQNLTYCKE